MHIGIDASRAAIDMRAGTGHYSLHVIRALLALEGSQQHNFTLYFNQPPGERLFPEQSNCALKTMPCARLWTHFCLSREMLTNAPDVLFVPAHVVPLIHPRRSVVTIHDLGYLYYPEAHPTLERWYLKQSTAWNARSATRIIADSEHTKQDIVRHLNVPPERVSVVYLAPSAEFRPDVDLREVASLLNRYGIDREYILYVGPLHARKNVGRLVEAFALLRQRGRVNPRLVIAGRKGWIPGEITRLLPTVGDSVTLMGFVSPEELPLLYAGAGVFVMPSLFEGFGLPVLEAMACGTPVIASNATSLPEVAGDAALLINPESAEEIASALEKVLADKTLQKELSEKGLERARQFTWQRAAADTMAVLEEAHSS
ncbi:MAG: glycosyltransferase family 4 protein [Chloroflexi bacterium]|nr:glycosyltransferase family 4 protein [Chloroflexota bacterium]